MRISGGLARGISLRVTKTNKLRPSTDANRERLFSSLGPFIEEKSILDLFAGTGAYGLEALSRGAVHGVFVEADRMIFKDLKKNFSNACKSASLPSSVGELENRDVTEFLKHCDSCFDLVFTDPPYSEIETLCSNVFELLKSRNLMSKDSLLVHEAPPEATREYPGWTLTRIIGKEKKGCPSFRLYKMEEPPLGQ